MESADLIKYLQHPHLLDKNSLIDIHQTLSTAPYFNVLHFLLLKNLKNIENEAYINQMPKSSVFIGNPALLFRFLLDISNEDTLNTPVIGTSDKVYAKSSNDLIVIEDFPADESIQEIPPQETKEAAQLLELEDEKNKDLSIEIAQENESPAENKKTSASKSTKSKNVRKKSSAKKPSVDSVSTIKEKTESKEVQTAQEESISAPDDLIESFIKAEPHIKPKKDLPPVIEDISVPSIAENEEFITETLADIYIKQGLLEKAIAAYEKLSLKFPEKNTYFANLIDELKKQLNNE
jgi:hypothetical protein